AGHGAGAWHRRANPPTGAARRTSCLALGAGLRSFRRPPHAESPCGMGLGSPQRPRHPVAIHIHSKREIEKMRATGRLAAQVLDFIEPFVVPGVTTDELDRRCHDFIVEHGAIPAPLNYKGFPRSICTSI